MKCIYGHVEAERPRRELNLYVTGYDETPDGSRSIVATAGAEPRHSGATKDPSRGVDGR